MAGSAPAIPSISTKNYYAIGVTWQEEELIAAVENAISGAIGQCPSAYRPLLENRERAFGRAGARPRSRPTTGFTGTLTLN